MNKIRLAAWLACVYLFLVAQATGQTIPSLSGKIVDLETGESLPGAAIYIPELKAGAISDAEGNFIIRNLPSKTISIQVTLIGYRTILEKVNLASVTTKVFQLSTIAREINEVVVTGSSNEVERNRTPGPVSIVTRHDLLENSSTNIIEALAMQPGLSSVSTGNAISKPVIRGLGFNRVVVVLDGIRQEGQQWGDEHGIEIDENSVEKIEVLKGPASLTFGSDAMAGVINMLSAPVLPEGTIKGGGEFTYRSNSGQAGYSLFTAGNKKNWIFNLRLSGKKAHDYRNGYDGSVFNSRFSEDAISGIVGLNRSWGYVHLHLNQYHLRPGIVEGERNVDGKFLQAVALNDSTIGSIPVPESEKDNYDVTIPYQNIVHRKASLNTSFIIGNSSLKAVIGIQQNRRKEIPDVLEPTVSELDMKLTTINYDLRLVLPEKNHFNVTLGLNGMHQESVSSGEEYLIPDYELTDGGLFVTGRKNIGKLDIGGGIRMDVRKETTSELYLDPEGSVATPGSPGSEVKFGEGDFTFTGLSGSIGVACQFSNHVYGKANLSSGFRAPNISELKSNGIHEGTFRYEIGNEGLLPEQSIQADLAIGVNTDHVTTEVSLFNNRVSNFIYLSALNNAAGTDSIIEDARAYQFIAQTANLAGGEVYIDIHPHPFDWLHFENTFSFVSGRLLHQPDSTRNLPMIPAPRLTTNIRIDGKKLGKRIEKPSFHITFLNYFAQNDVHWANGTETPTPSYLLIHTGVEGTIKLGKVNVHAGIGITNLADKSYQSHLSRLKYAPENPATGRMGVFNEGRSVNFKLGINL